MSKKLPPIHPGEILREEFMKPMGLSSTRLARALEVTPARVNEIVRERRGITADTALRLAQFLEQTCEAGSTCKPTTTSSARRPPQAAPFSGSGPGKAQGAPRPLRT